MIYPMMVPPLEFESFKSMTKKQVQQYFDWYISCIPERVKLLDECFNGIWRRNIRFDYSLESLDPLWQEFEKHIRIIKKSKRQIMKENKGASAFVIDALLWDRRELTRETLVIALDISIYFGETLARNLPGVHWGFFTKPKSMASVNKPVLLGFECNLDLDPMRIILTGCYISMDKSNPHFMSEAVNAWKRHLL